MYAAGCVFWEQPCFPMVTLVSSTWKSKMTQLTRVDCCRFLHTLCQNLYAPRNEDRFRFWQGRPSVPAACSPPHKIGGRRVQTLDLWLLSQSNKQKRWTNKTVIFNCLFLCGLIGVKDKSTTVYTRASIISDVHVLWRLILPTHGHTFLEYFMYL